MEKQVKQTKEVKEENKIILIKFDGEVYCAILDGKEIGADRSRGQLIVRTRKRISIVTFQDA